MIALPTREVLALSAVLGAGALVGCANPDAPSTAPGRHTAGSLQNVGELRAPTPPSPAAQAPEDAQSSPSAAARAFGELYVNWSYETLGADQRALAGISIGAARLSERQAAAASARDSTIARAHVFNRGSVVSVAPDALRAGWWAIVTREQTGGDRQYEGLPAAYHVTLAQLASVPGGWAVEQWLPQS
jgi:hypothetical protein